jgi:hypothetical protein
MVPKKRSFMGGGMRFKTTAIGVFLLLHAWGSYGLTLGALQGNAWLGRRLEVSAVAQLNAGQSTTALCASAEIFHADTKVDGSRVRVLTEPTGRTDEVILRIVSSATVDEPVVTIQLRVGCDSETVRRYVLLPDAPTEFVSSNSVLPAVSGAEAPVASVPAPSVPSGSGRQPEVASSDSEKPAAAVSSASIRKPEKKAAVVPAKPVAKVPVAAAIPPPATAAGAGRGRLTLEPLVLPAERVTAVEPVANTEQVDELLKTAQRMEQLQTDIKVLLDQAAANDANQRALQARLQKAEETRFPDSLVYLLTGLLTLCLGAIVMYWRRSASLIRLLENERRVPVATVEAPDTIQQPEIPSPSLAPAVKPKPSPLDVDVNWLHVDEKGFSEIMDPKPTRPADLAPMEAPVQPRDETAIAPPDFNSEDQLALVDQAQLFVQLGKTDHAISILEKRIREKAADCPLVFLELLQIANQQSLKVDFRQFRDEMQQVFNVAIPEFALFRSEGRKLDGYPDVSQRIAKLGPSYQALTEIESCIVLSAWGNNAEPFDLAAFKELVHIHGVALKAVQSSSGSRGTSEPGGSAPITEVDLPL